MKKTYLIPAMECLEIQTSTICVGSGKDTEADPKSETEPMPGPLAPRHL